MRAPGVALSVVVVVVVVKRRLEDGVGPSDRSEAAFVLGLDPWSSTI